jgi:RNA polymerase sigma-70 factor (ECF subfamily)
MFYRNSYDGIDGYAADLIRHKARQLVGKAGLTEDDRQDLEQELMIDLLQRMRHFNPAKAKKTTFMARIVERHISTILEARFAQCRDWRLCQTSLNEPLDNGEGDTTERIDFLDSDGQMGHHGRDTNEQRQNDIRFDLERVIAALPEDLQDLCEKLQSSNMAEIAREMGVPRSTLYGKLTKLRDAFRDGGLEEYL